MGGKFECGSNSDCAQLDSLLLVTVSWALSSFAYGFLNSLVSVLD